MSLRTQNRTDGENNDERKNRCTETGRPWAGYIGSKIFSGDAAVFGGSVFPADQPAADQYI